MSAIYFVFVYILLCTSYISYLKWSKGNLIGWKHNHKQQWRQSDYKNQTFDDSNERTAEYPLNQEMPCMKFHQNVYWYECDGMNSEIDPNIFQHTIFFLSLNGILLLTKVT